ncbi:MAG: hypothetical protein JSW60_04010 [Thermoplasmatales archaeon]|nr:MAG: hypothetical protein JSW60_04010 [Thermoplasmatales archaeon]
MDDTTFNRFLNIVINQIQKENEHEDVNINEVITTINQLRDNPDRTILDYTDKNGKYTWKGEFLVTVCWFLGCILYMITGYVTLVIFVLTLFIPSVIVVICELPTLYHEIVCNK